MIRTTSAAAVGAPGRGGARERAAKPATPSAAYRRFQTEPVSRLIPYRAHKTVIGASSRRQSAMNFSFSSISDVTFQGIGRILLPSGVTVRDVPGLKRQQCRRVRSEEHTSELQSLMRISYAVFCLKKKTQNTDIHKIHKYQSQRLIS